VHELAGLAPAADVERAGARPAALLVHANGFHGRVFAPLAARLTCAGRRFAPDLRGHGDSDTPAALDALGWEDFADDVLAVVDALAIDRLLGIGHSLGGAALLLAEHRRPGTFAALFVYEPVVFPPDDEPAELLPDADNPMVQGALRRKDLFASYQDAYDNFASKPPLDVLDPDALREYVQHGFAPNPDGTVSLKCRGETEAQIYRTGRDHRAFERLAGVGCPVTVACGAAEPFGPSTIAPVVAARLPHGRLERFDELGHFGPLERPAVLAAAIDRALSAG
jgi:pimeloyl-ACP methyl ester carboxylesterase